MHKIFLTKTAFQKNKWSWMKSSRELMRLPSQILISVSVLCNSKNYSNPIMRLSHANRRLLLEQHCLFDNILILNIFALTKNKIINLWFYIISHSFWRAFRDLQNNWKKCWSDSGLCPFHYSPRCRLICTLDRGSLLLLKCLIIILYLKSI